jgi:hypothetical protein
VGSDTTVAPVLVTVLVNGQTKTVLIGAIQKNGGASSVIGAQGVIPPLNFTEDGVLVHFGQRQQVTADCIRSFIVGTSDSVH